MGTFQDAYLRGKHRREKREAERRQAELNQEQSILHDLLRAMQDQITPERVDQIRDDINLILETLGENGPEDARIKPIRLFGGIVNPFRDPHLGDYNREMKFLKTTENLLEQTYLTTILHQLRQDNVKYTFFYHIDENAFFLSIDRVDLTS